MEYFLVSSWIPIMKKFFLEFYQRMHLTPSKSLKTKSRLLPSVDTMIYLATTLFIASFKQYTRDGLLGKTGQLCFYMDHILLVFQLTKTVKTNYFLLYALCPFLMCDLFFLVVGVRITLVTLHAFLFSLPTMRHCILVQLCL